MEGLPAEPPSGPVGTGTPWKAQKCFPSPEQAEGLTISIPSALPFSVLYKLFIQL